LERSEPELALNDLFDDPPEEQKDTPIQASPIPYRPPNHQLPVFEFRNIEGDIVRPSEFREIPTRFVGLRPAYDSDLEKDENAIMFSVTFENQQLDIWMKVPNDPADGEKIARIIDEHFELENDDWQLLLPNGSVRPNDHLISHRDVFQIDLLRKDDPTHEEHQMLADIVFQNESFIQRLENPSIRAIRKLVSERWHIPGDWFFLLLNGTHEQQIQNWSEESIIRVNLKLPGGLLTDSELDDDWTKMIEEWGYSPIELSPEEPPSQIPVIIRVCFGKAWILVQTKSIQELRTWLQKYFLMPEQFELWKNESELLRDQDQLSPYTSTFIRTRRRNLWLSPFCPPMTDFAQRRMDLVIQHRVLIKGRYWAFEARLCDVETRIRQFIWSKFAIEDSEYQIWTKDAPITKARIEFLPTDFIAKDYNQTRFETDESKMTPCVLLVEYNKKSFIIHTTRVSAERMAREKLRRDMRLLDDFYTMKILGKDSEGMASFAPITLIKIEIRHKSGCCEHDQGCIRVLIENCPKLKMAVLDSLTPTSALYGLIQDRGYKPASFRLYLGSKLLTDEIIHDGAMIRFEEVYILIFLEDCPQLTQLNVSMSTPWTALRNKLIEIGYPESVFTCSVNTQFCTDQNIVANSHIRFHISGLGGGIGGPVITDNLLDDVDYPDSSSSSDSEADAREEYQNKLQKWVSGKTRLEERYAALEKLVQAAKGKTTDNEVLQHFRDSHAEELTEVHLQLMTYPPRPKWTPYVHSAEEEEESPEEPEGGWPITGDELFPPELKVADPKPGQRVSFQRGDFEDIYEYDPWRRCWGRINIRPDDPDITPKHKHHHKKATLALLDAPAEPGDPNWRMVAKPAKGKEVKQW
jgi:hypothetical protein